MNLCLTLVANVLLNAAVAAEPSVAVTVHVPQTSMENAARAVPRKPVISGRWRTLVSKDQIDSPDIRCGQIVDHCFFRDASGTWQAWVQIRDTAMGRVFTRWEQKNDFTSTPWTYHGVCWEADQSVGESVGTPKGSHVIQAPYVFRDAKEFLLVYGGGPVDAQDTTRQVCLARSSDGVSFRRERNGEGYSRIAVGPRHAADAHLLQHGGEYYLYVGAQYFAARGAQSAVTLRRSRDLRNWSDFRVVHAGGISGTHTHSSQSQFVLFLDGYFYLFKMGWSSDNRTAVYRSADLEDFGHGDDKLVAVLRASAAEVIHDQSRWYLSSLIVEDRSYAGVKVAPLEWIEDAAPQHESPEPQELKP